VRSRSSVASRLGRPAPRSAESRRPRRSIRAAKPATAAAVRGRPGWPAWRPFNVLALRPFRSASARISLLLQSEAELDLKTRFSGRPLQGVALWASQSARHRAPTRSRRASAAAGRLCCCQATGIDRRARPRSPPPVSALLQALRPVAAQHRASRVRGIWGTGRCCEHAFMPAGGVHEVRASAACGSTLWRPTCLGAIGG